MDQTINYQHMKKAEQKSPLDREVGVYAQGRNGGYFKIGASPLRKQLTGISDSLIKRIKLYRKTGDKEVKAGLHCYTPAGYYGDTPRSLKSKMQVETLQVHLDFDEDNEGLKQIFDECKFITAAGKSCGGKGMFFLVNTDGKDYDGYFYALSEYFKENYNKQVDLAVSSKNELRFVSLPDEVLIREDPTLWKLSKERPEPVFSLERLSGLEPGKVIEVPKDKIGKLHYADLSSYAGLSNSQGVPVEEAADYIASIPFSKKSHLYNKADTIKGIVYKHYDVYAEQHGESAARVSLMKREQVSGNIELPELVFSKTSSMEMIILQIVRAVMSKYSIVVDKFRISYKYNGEYWEEITETQLDHFLVACAEATGYSPAKAGTLKFRDGLLKLTYKEAGINELGTDRTAFNLSNGILVFNKDHTVTFSKHDPKRYFNYKLGYEYNPKARCPKFDVFINRVMPNKDDQETFFQYVASVFDVSRIEKMLFLIGSGANGKSTLFDVIKELFGDACGHTNLYALTNPNQDAASKAALSIYNKLLAVSHDDRGINDHEMFKTIASRDVIFIKSLFVNAIQSNQYARLMIGMNSWPNIEVMPGAARRFIAIPMTVTIPESEQNTRLREELNKELSGIFNRVVAAHTSGKGIKVSDNAKAFTKDVLEESDVVIQFLKEGGINTVKESDRELRITNLRKIYESDGSKLSARTVNDLYPLFRDHCEAAGVRYVLGRKAFGKRLKMIWGEQQNINTESRKCIGWWVIEKTISNF